MKKVLIGCLGILLMLGLTVFWYLSRFDSEQDIPETAQSTLRETHTGPVLGSLKMMSTYGWEFHMLNLL